MSKVIRTADDRIEQLEAALAAKARLHPDNAAAVIALLQRDLAA